MKNAKIDLKDFQMEYVTFFLIDTWVHIALNFKRLLGMQ